MTRSIYRSVVSDSLKYTSLGLIAAIIAVLEFPDRESFSNQVSTELRKGTCSLPLDSALMTSPRAAKERLMLFASVNRSPEAPVNDARSLPARSIRLIRQLRVEQADRIAVEEEEEEEEEEEDEES